MYTAIRSWNSEQGPLRPTWIKNYDANFSICISFSFFRTKTAYVPKKKKERRKNLKHELMSSVMEALVAWGLKQLLTFAEWYSLPLVTGCNVSLISTSACQYKICSLKTMRQPQRNDVALCTQQWLTQRLSSVCARSLTLQSKCCISHPKASASLPKLTDESMKHLTCSNAQALRAYRSPQRWSHCGAALLHSWAPGHMELWAVSPWSMSVSFPACLQTTESYTRSLFIVTWLIFSECRWSPLSILWLHCEDCSQ